MIAARDTLSLAPGVTVEHGRLADAVRGDSWPLNASGAFVLARTGDPVGLIVRELADVFSLSDEAARADVLRFAWHLNALALVNVESGVSRSRRLADWIRLAARLAPAGALPAAATRRRAIDTRTVRRAFGSCLAAISARVSVVAASERPSPPSSRCSPEPPGLSRPSHARARYRGRARLARGGTRGLASRCSERARHAWSPNVRPSRAASVRHAARSSPWPVRWRLLGVGIGLVVAGAIVGAPALAIAGCPLAAHALALTVVGRRREGRMRALKAFLLGALAVGALAYALLATLALTAQAGGRTLDVTLGPLVFVSVGEESEAIVTTFGPGVVVLALVGGLANLAAARPRPAPRRRQVPIA